MIFDFSTGLNHLQIGINALLYFTGIISLTSREMI